MEFQQQKRGCETLDELMRLPSVGDHAKVTVILNHFQRKTLCVQLDAFLEQTLPFHEIWVVAFGSPEVATLRSIVEAYNDTRINIVESKYDYRYYGRFQLALQVSTVSVQNLFQLPLELFLELPVLGFEVQVAFLAGIGHRLFYSWQCSRKVFVHL